MNNLLNSNPNLLEIAQQAAWSVEEMAKLCKVSHATLRRHIIQRTSKTPDEWLTEQQFYLAIQLLRKGTSIKEIATSLGYQHQTNFTRKFKKFWDICPSQWRQSKKITAHLPEND